VIAHGIRKENVRRNQSSVNPKSGNVNKKNAKTRKSAAKSQFAVKNHQHRGIKIQFAVTPHAMTQLFVTSHAKKSLLAVIPLLLVVVQALLAMTFLIQ
jgi:hypothetical protein